MSRRAAAAVALVLTLAGCTPGAPEPSAGSTSTSTPMASATASATSAAQPVDVDPATYLIDGTPGVPDEDGYWKGHYAFFTDDTQTVRCDIYIYSGDSGSLTCAVTAGNDSTVTYALPAAHCDSSSSNPYDGLSVGINFKVFDKGNAGFTGCGVGAFFESSPGNELPSPRVLHNNETLIVEHATERFVCTVAGGVASCAETGSGASIVFGLSVAQFAG